MSFGKDRRVLESIPSFADQHRRHEASQPKRGGKGGGSFAWKNRYTPTDTATGKADVIRLFRGVHTVPQATPADDNTFVVENVKMSYFPYTEHGTDINGYKSSICSAGPIPTKEGRLPCIGCDRFWEGKAAKKDLMSRHTKYAFTVLHFHPYALVPDVDKDGNERQDKDGKPYMSWVRTSPALLRGEHAGRETRDYNLMHWSLGYKDFQVLLTQSYSIAERCVNCEKGKIEVLGYSCPSCGSPRIDMANTMFSEAEVAELAKNPFTCSVCGAEGMLDPQVDCSGCANPIRADIFDVDLYVKQPLDPKTGKRGPVNFVGFSEPGPVPERYLAGENPIFQQLELDKLFAPTPLEEQKSKFLVAGTPKVGGKQAARSWGTKPPTL